MKQKKSIVYMSFLHIFKHKRKRILNNLLLFVILILTNNAALLAQIKTDEYTDMHLSRLQISYKENVIQVKDTNYWVLQIKYYNITPEPYILCLNRWSISMGSIQDCGKEFLCTNEQIPSGYNHIVIKRLGGAQYSIEAGRFHWYSNVIKEDNPILKLIAPNDSFFVNLFVPDTTARSCLKAGGMKIDFFPTREISKHTPTKGFINDSCLNVFFKSYKYPYTLYEFHTDITQPPKKAEKFALLRRNKYCRIAHERTYGSVY
jgi:hypothetical protein